MKQISHRIWARSTLHGALLVAFFLSSCTVISHGNTAVGDDQRIARILRGRSTRYDVQQLLGQPEQIAKPRRDLEVWTYKHFRKHLNVLFVTTIPLISPKELKDQMVIVVFDSKGLVMRVSKKPYSATA